MHVSREHIEEAALQAASETFAEMTFLDVIADEEKRDFTEGQLLSIEIHEPAAGQIIMALPTELKRSIVENIHATDWQELSVNDIDDCLLEVLNVYAGDFARALFGKETQVKLSFPAVLFSLEELPDSEDFYRVHLDAEGQPFRVDIHLNAEVEET